MEKTNTPSFDEVSAPKETLHPNRSKREFHETAQPLGVHFHAFLDDFIFDYIPDNLYSKLDENSAQLRGVLVKAEKALFEIELCGLKLEIRIRIGKEGEEWKVNI